MRRILPALCLCLVGLFNGACHKSETAASEIDSTGKITDVLFAAQLALESPRIMPSAGSAPSAGAGPIANVSGTTTVSGELQFAFNLDSSTAFQRILVTVPGKTGFIQVDLPAATTTQSLLLSFNALVSNVTIQFQLVSVAGAVGPVASLPLTVVSGKTASLTAIVTPDPIPFSGKICTLSVPIDPTTGCIFEATMTLSEVGGAAVTVMQYTATWTFGGAATPRVFTAAALPSGEPSIPANGFRMFPVLVRCGTPTCDGSFFAASAGTLSVAITGIDSAGHAVNFKTRLFVLRPQ